MEKELISNNVKPTQVENINNYNELIKSIICFVCLEIPLNPLECQTCDSIICEECTEVLRIAGHNCLKYKCSGKINKANKFVRETLSKLIIRCSYCGKKKILYQNYSKHLEESCDVFKLIPFKRSTFIKSIKEQTIKINNIQEQIDNLKMSTTMNILRNSPRKYSREKIRNMLMTFELPVNKKMELFNATVQGDLTTFKNLILNKNYPILEEISASKFYWTPLHYAMHYGQLLISQFIFKILQSENKIELTMQLISSDGRCPLLCLLKSNTLDSESKKLLFGQLYKEFKFPISSSVKRELLSRNMENLIEH